MAFFMLKNSQDKEGKVKKKIESKNVMTISTPEQKHAFTKMMITTGLLDYFRVYQEKIKNMTYMEILKGYFTDRNAVRIGDLEANEVWMEMLMPNVDRYKLKYNEFKELIKIEDKKAREYLQLCRDKFFYDF